MTPTGHKGSKTLFTTAFLMQESEAQFNKAGAAENTFHMEWREKTSRVCTVMKNQEFKNSFFQAREK